MSLFQVTLTMEIGFTLEAKSLREAEEAVAELDNSELQDFGGWGEWERSVIGGATAGVGDCGVWKGEVLAWEDYQRKVQQHTQEHPEEEQRKREAEQASYVLPLPFTEK